MPRFRKKPVEIEARRYTGDNTRDIALWVQPDLAPFALPKGWWQRQKDGGEFRLVIPTLEGEMDATPGDWIIRGVKGEYYPCKPDIFAVTYEPVDEGAPA
ncbi:hypothetical protein [Pseudooceanicola sp. 200-1SW]|uniref:hypothetical protein n=1 Tax=Pseudooceanicola sp. 200-1SW TaxID=3425949 RepID=UPI003D7F9613